MNNEAYVKQKIKPREMNIVYEDKEVDFKTEYNFRCIPISINQDGIIFTTGYNNDKESENIFILNTNQAIELANKLLNCATESLTINTILEEAKLCEARLSFLVLKHLIDTIVIERSEEELENYDPPYYKYHVIAYKDKKIILEYTVVNDLSNNFTSEKAIEYWWDTLTDKKAIKLICQNWSPYEDLEKKLKDLEDSIK